jgi:hypothetical protein
VDLGEANEFNERRIYDDQNTTDLLTIAVEVLGKKPINRDMWARARTATMYTLYNERDVFFTAWAVCLELLN